MLCGRYLLHVSPALLHHSPCPVPGPGKPQYTSPQQPLGLGLIFQKAVFSIPFFAPEGYISVGHVSGGHMMKYSEYQSI